MKIWFIALPLLAVAGAGRAQDVEPAVEPAATAAPQPSARDKAAAPRPKQRQGADMRHCLDRKDARAIIRCAEPGRKP
ncbi:MAG: hypothetical protein K0M66_15185 [Thiobacillus sp.]|nr:hypothetical protein [Thiobacillus sp.]